jgi:aldehyde dehydrogenase (NAD+)
MIDRIMSEFGVSLESNRPISGVYGARPIESPSGGTITSYDPTDERPLATIAAGGPADYDRVVDDAAKAFESWRSVPAPVRGEFVRLLGVKLRRHKADLASLLTAEVGKTTSEAAGEVQEMIDMCDFAVGLSRQLHGLVIAGERPMHRMIEQWHPLGVVGVISAFNFPVAVWAWNGALAAICGDTVVWKPSELAPLCSIAVHQLCVQVMNETGRQGVFNLCVGDAQNVGKRLVADRRIALVSATGSVAMGRSVGPVVADRFGRSLLELGGNNAIIVTPAADLEIALRSVVFSAVGTSGQRCTTLRRLFVHRSIIEPFTARIVKAYRGIKIGDPREPGTLMGPLIGERSVVAMMTAVEKAVAQGGKLLVGGKRLDRKGWFVEPTLIQSVGDLPISFEETFAPILYVSPYDDLDEAIKRQNQVPQGLSSSIFTNDLREAERFLSAVGSDCGIANVNIGTSGAEIGGAFGGEKETGGGRESGSDCWKYYMRRQTCTTNFGRESPLAQGVRFDLE